MPAKSAKQERFMQAVAHNPAFAKKAGVPQSVGKEFMKKPKKFSGGGLSEEREVEDPEVRKLYKKYKEANELPIGGKIEKIGASFYSPNKKSAEEAYDKLQNMREEEIEAKRGEEKRQREAQRTANRRTTMQMDMEDARKQGKSYDKYYEDERKAALKTGALNRGAYKAGLSAGLSSPEQIKSEYPHAFAKGGTVKESKAMVGKEVAFMKKKGAPKSMIQHEMGEMEGMKPSRMKKFARGGGIERKGKTRGKMC